MKRPITLLSTIAGILILLSLPFVFYPSTPYQPDEPIQSESEKQYKAVTFTESKPDWTLLIPQIDFEQQMLPIQRQGKKLPVPDLAPGYYSEHEGNLFIVGHNQSVFRRLKELPSEIIIYQEGEPKQYTFTNSEIAPVENIDMESLLSFRGIVIMTCDGDYQNNEWTHRLILYYE